MKSFISIILFLTIFIPAIAQDTLVPPQNLRAEVFNNSVSLTWVSPTLNTDYLSWENGVISNSIGLTDGGIYTVAAKWDPDQIPGFVGEQIEKVSIHTSGLNSNYTLKIWKGEMAETLLLSQPIEGIVANQWYDVMLDSAITIDATEPLWAGYEIDQAAGDFPASVDSGPAVTGFGDWIYYNEVWDLLSNYGLSYNWSIRVYTSGTGEQLLPSPDMNEKPAFASTGKSVSKSPFQMNTSPLNPESVNGLIGYNVYANGEKLNSEPVTYTLYNAGVFETGNYDFGVTAVYDEGESAPAEVNVVVGGNEVAFDPFYIDANISSGEILDIPVIMTNTGINSISWEVSVPQPWLNLSETQGFLEPGDSQEIVFTIDANNLNSGYIYEYVLFTLNNVITPSSYFQVWLMVEGDPSITISPENLDFGNVEMGSTRTSSFQILNDGLSEVLIDSIVSGSTVFLVNNQSYTLSPYQHLNLPVVFNPDSLVDYEAEINVYTDIQPDPYILTVSGSGVLAAPSYFNVSVSNENDATLAWLPPSGSGSGNGTTLSWDNGENSNAIGYGAQATFSYGARWTPEYLQNADGQTALSVSFFPYAESSSFTLNIYTGENAVNLIVSQPIGNYIPYTWNVININTPFMIDASDELWVTFEVFNADGEYPAGTDSGPAISGFGDLISSDNVTWQSLNTSYGLNFNWNIQLFATDEFSASAPHIIPENFRAFENQGSILEHPNFKKAENSIIPPMHQSLMADDFLLLGYNLYRDNLKLNDVIVSELTFIDPNLEPGTYQYEVAAVYDAGESPRLADYIQIGGPELVIEPESIIAELESGTIAYDTILLSNTGNIVLNWEAISTSNLVIPAQTSGEIEPGESQQLIITFDATFINGGTLNLGIYFNTNDFNNPQTYFPVTMIVEGSPYLFVSNQEINFGNTGPGETKTRYVEVYNYGAGNGNIFNLNVDNEAFLVADSSYVVPVFQSVQIPVEFNPQDIGTYSGTLTFTTDDPTTPTFTIQLTGNGYLMPPLNLNATVAENNVTLSWIPPDGGEGDYLQYDNGDNYQAVGLTGGGTFAVASKWEAGQLISSVGKFVSSIGFFPSTETASFTIKVWKGNNHDTLLVSQLVSDYTPYEWSDIFLTNPVEITEGETYFFGYEVNNPIDDFPAGVDSGPAVAGYGDLLTLDGVNWEHLTNYGLDFNWNLRVFVSESKNSSLTAQALPNNLSFYQNTGSFVELNQKYNKHKSSQSTEFLTFNGYNIYRDGIKLNNDPVLDNNYLDENLEFGTYFYEVTAVYDNGESNPAGPIEAIVEEPAQLPEGWEHSHTNTTHIIYIPTTTVQLGSTIMDNGDWIGIFYQNNGIEYCGGAAQWVNNDTIKVIGFGDDPQTSTKEGFELGEYMTWKAYMLESGDEQVIEVNYHTGMPNTDGKFDAFGLSMLTSVNLLPTATANFDFDKDLSIFPNPSNGSFYISSSENIETIRIYNFSGQEIFIGENLFKTSLDFQFTDLESGSYVIFIRTSDGTQISKKLLIY